MKLVGVAATVALFVGVQTPAEAATTILRAAARTDAAFDHTGAMTRVLDTSGFGAAPVAISSITLDRGALGGLGAGVFRLTFWTNDGLTKVGDFGAFDITVLGGEEVTLGGEAFLYEASRGPLMLRVEAADPNARGGGGGLGGGGGALLSAPGLANPSGGEGLDPDSRLGDSAAAVLRNLAPPEMSISVSAVPEPSTWATLIGGFAGLGVVLRRRRLRPAV